MKELVKERSYFVVKDNRLIAQSRPRENSKRLSLQQQKLLLYFVSRIKPLDEETTEYVFEIKEFMEIYGHVDGGAYYKRLKDDIQIIADKVSFWVKVGNGETLYRWINRPHINSNSGKITITFDKDVSQFLFNLNEKYTQYSLFNILCLSHKYAIKLYEYLLVFINRNSIIVEIDELRLRIEADGKAYDKLSNFKNKIIKPAIDDINKYTDIYAEYEFIKPADSREYTQIKFTMRYKTDIESVDASLASVNRLNPDTRKRSRELERRLNEARQAREEFENISDEDLPD